MWSAYFDDFRCLSRESEANHIDFCVTLSSHFLVGKSPRTNSSPSRPFAKFWVYSWTWNNQVTHFAWSLTHQRESRWISSGHRQNILLAGTLSRAEDERLRGRLQFASTQVFGRKLKRLLKVVSNHYGQKVDVWSDKRVHQACQLSSLAIVLGQLLPRSRTFFTFVWMFPWTNQNTVV